MCLPSTLTETYHTVGEIDQVILIWKDVRFGEEFHIKSLKKTSEVCEVRKLTY